MGLRAFIYLGGVEMESSEGNEEAEPVLEGVRRTEVEQSVAVSNTREAEWSEPNLDAKSTKDRNPSEAVLLAGQVAELHPDEAGKAKH